MRRKREGQVKDRVAGEAPDAGDRGTSGAVTAEQRPVDVPPISAGYERALAQLSERQREAVILRVEMGYRYREIAEGMELDTANAARKLVARALVRLAEIMRGHHGT